MYQIQEETSTSRHPLLHATNHRRPKSKPSNASSTWIVGNKWDRHTNGLRTDIFDTEYISCHTYFRSPNSFLSDSCPCKYIYFHFTSMTGTSFWRARQPYSDEPNESILMSPSHLSDSCHRISTCIQSMMNLILTSPVEPHSDEPDEPFHPISMMNLILMSPTSFWPTLMSDALISTCIMYI